MKTILVLCVVMCSSCLATSNKGTRLTRLENRLDIMETRQDQDRIASREDITELGLRLECVETLVNSSVIGPIPCPSSDDQPQVRHRAAEDMNDRMASDKLIVEMALSEETARWNQEAADLENMISDIKHEVTNFRKMSDKHVKREVRRLEKKIMNIGKSCKQVQNDVKRVETSIKALQESDKEVKSDVARLEMSIKAMKDDISNNLETKVPTVQSTADSMVLQNTLSKLETTTAGLNSTPRTRAATYYSCLEIYKSGERQSGVYDIYPGLGIPSVKAYCDMDTDGGGWTVFQRRKDGSVSFDRNWEEYASGFGNLDGEFWLGNTHLSAMTSDCCQELRVELGDIEENHAFAKYTRFQVLPETENFRLEVGGYSGNASDSLGYHDGKEFSTHDHENGLSSWGNLALKAKGAWWFGDFYESNLNGEYQHGAASAEHLYEGVSWYGWKKSYLYPLETAEMKFRRLDN